MAKYDVTYTCGHTDTVVLFGKMKARYERIEWLEKNCVCPACYAAQKREERDAETAKNLETVNTTAMVDLQGSPKQIAWATDIRAKFLAEFEKEKAARIPLEDEAKEARAIDAVNKTEKFLYGQTNASWWIDYRNMSLGGILRAERSAILGA